MKEYVDNLINSGVYGVVLVLELIFNVEVMVIVLGIFSGKYIFWRYLVEEMSVVFYLVNFIGIWEVECFGMFFGRVFSVMWVGKEENSSGFKYKVGWLFLGKIGRGFSSKDFDFYDDYGFF